MKSWLGDSITYTEQVQGDLGKRMHSAIKSAIHIGCTKVVLIGTDILELIPGHVEQAFNALDKTDIVLGPTIDGGYWLVGMRMAFNIFTGIPWGTETVIAQTLELIKQQGLRLFILPKISDIDDVDDLKKCSDHKIVKQHLSVWLPSRDSPHD
jgi:rSAM/selenodomain-associated transferase 1